MKKKMILFLAPALLLAQSPVKVTVAQLFNARVALDKIGRQAFPADKGADLLFRLARINSALNPELDTARKQIFGILNDTNSTLDAASGTRAVKAEHSEEVNKAQAKILSESITLNVTPLTWEQLKSVSATISAEDIGLLGPFLLMDAPVEPKAEAPPPVTAKSK